MKNPDNIHPIQDRLLSKAAKEKLLNQKGRVLWFYGLSGSGKSTIAIELERKLQGKGQLTVVLDGDNVRSGLCRDLSFSLDDRAENIRRVAEVSKIMAHAGIVAIVSLITPRESHRDQARAILEGYDLGFIYVNTSFEVCSKRDPKGLYEKAKEGSLKKFTGKDSLFEYPGPANVDLQVDTEERDISQCVEEIMAKFGLNESSA